MVKPFIIGENNPLSSDPKFALYPLPRGSTGDRLCRLILQMKRHEYLTMFERRDLLSQEKWSVVAARASATMLAEEMKEAPVILLGSKVCAAFRLPFEPFTVVANPFTRKLQVAILPHPSGLCRAWGVKGAFARAR